MSARAGSGMTLRELYEQALAIAREVGDRSSEGQRHDGLAVLHHDQGRMEEARKSYEEALAIATALEMRQQLVKIHRTRARVLGSLGSDGLERAEADLDAAVRAAEECSAPGLLPGIHVERAGLCAHRGDAEGRRRELEAAQRLYREMDAIPNAERVAAQLGS